VAKVSKATSNQEANDALQRSITELLAVINQVARGDLAQRGKVTNDAAWQVTDSINYMLDNFSKVLERVRKAAMESPRASNNILVAADENAGRRYAQDQEITNTSSAVEELTVSMKQVRTTPKPAPKLRAARWTPLSRATAPYATHWKECRGSRVRASDRKEDQIARRSVRWKFLKSST